jgi:hypothetical protein
MIALCRKTGAISSERFWKRVESAVHRGGARLSRAPWHASVEDDNSRHGARTASSRAPNGLSRNVAIGVGRDPLSRFARVSRYSLASGYSTN